MNTVNAASTYAISGLRRCWMPDRGTWSHKYHLDGRNPANESKPYSDLYYSLNVLLGLSKVRSALASEPYDIPVLFATICNSLPITPLRNGAWGMALWAAAELGLDVPASAADWLRPLAAEVELAAGWTVQDVGLSLSGATAQARHDRSWRPLADVLSRLLLDRFRGPGALFRDAARGPRRQFATFASQIYAALALYQYGELTEDGFAIAAANACAAKVIALQGPLGEWPWFYSPRGDRVLEPYEIYSVHQYGMAPALLHHAVQYGVPGARNAIVRGFGWIFGINEMRTSMLVPTLSLVYRSQARCGFDGSRIGRLIRASVAATTSGARWSSNGTGLCLTKEMRSYEFGWLLWSFGGRSDFPELTDRIEFSTPAC